MITFKHAPGAEDYTERVIAKLNNPKFIEDAKSITGFDPKYTRPSVITGFEILRPLLETTTEILTIGFYTQNWFAYKAFPVNGYVDASGRKMFLNTRNIWRDLSDIEETIWHELVHVSDSINTQALYWHADNNLTGKQDTAPVKFAAWAARWRE